MRKLLDQLGGWPRVLMMTSIVVIAMSLQPILGTNGWAGLGQWAGGLGAFFAAWAALDIAKQEARRESDREAARGYVQAHYVKVSQTEVGARGIHLRIENQGDQPIIDVGAVAVHIHGEAGEVVVPCSLPAGRRDVLLREDLPWDPWIWPDNNDLDGTIEQMTLANGRTEIEITFDDLNRTRWRRIGSRPPEVVAA
ncbi:hypothetical protein [Amycolatopsis sp. lyj-23]|uniref:hypothetical protein n=1 Tax=Amycolatopsis sp. lyj-23 TaxID=2789283 RepID=UPI00397AB541